MRGGTPFGEGADDSDGKRVDGARLEVEDGTKFDAGATVTAAGGSIMGEAIEGNTVTLGLFGLGALLLTGVVVVDGAALGGLTLCALGIDVADGAADEGDSEVFEDDPFPDPLPDPFPDPFPDGALLGMDFE